MLNYLKYMITVPRKFILNWAISGGVYLLILPLAFANSSVESLLIDTQRDIKFQKYRDGDLPVYQFSLKWDVDKGIIREYNRDERDY